MNSVRQIEEMGQSGGLWCQGDEEFWRSQSREISGSNEYRSLVWSGERVRVAGRVDGFDSMEGGQDRRG